MKSAKPTLWLIFILLFSAVPVLSYLLWRCHQGRSANYPLTNDQTEAVREVRLADFSAKSEPFLGHKIITTYHGTVQSVSSRNIDAETVLVRVSFYTRTGSLEAVEYLTPIHGTLRPKGSLGFDWTGGKVMIDPEDYNYGYYYKADIAEARYAK